MSMSSVSSSTLSTSSSYEVCCVGSPDACTENLKLTFEAMDSSQLHPIWINPEDCLKVSRKEPKLFVIDPFEGEVFDHLKSVKCRIVGPLCIRYCLQNGNILPKRPYPVYSVSMRKLTVTCSNIPNSLRDELETKVLLMGGLVSKDLTKSVSHLVAGEVGSKKYQVSGSFGLPIMTPAWINEVWDNGQHQLLHASNSFYHKFKCPIFKGLVVTVSQLSAEERSTIQKIVEENGGSYLAALKAYKTSHLVLVNPIGDKYRYAKNWKIYCVNVNWIYESVKAGYCTDENLYRIDDSSKPIQPKRSTPNRDMTSSDLPLVDCSAITNASIVTQLDETIRSEVSLPIANKKSSWILALEAFNPTSLPKNGQFLDGFKIFLTGFTSSHLDLLRKMVNSGGGMRFNKYSESITHVVCGDLSEDTMESIKSSSVKPYVVNPNWLLECCQSQNPVEEKPFVCMDTSPLSPEKIEMEEVKPVLLSQTHSKSQTKLDVSPPDNITDIFKQYISDENNQPSSFRKSDIGQPSSRLSRALDLNSSNSKQNVIFNPAEVEIAELDEEEEEAHSDDSEQLFAGIKFVLIGFEEKDQKCLASMIEEHSGKLCRDTDEGVADIAVVKIIWNDYNHEAPNIVTNCWLSKCVEDSKLYDFDENELFRPLIVPPGKLPFKTLVMSLSQYVGAERDCLMHLVELLGGSCQDYFVRKANPSRNIKANTHLIVAMPEGSKYKAAKKWKIPAVTKDWVLESAKQGVELPVEKYLVDAICQMPNEEEEITEIFPVITKELSSNTSSRKTISNPLVELDTPASETNTFKAPNLKSPHTNSLKKEMRNSYSIGVGDGESTKTKGFTPVRRFSELDVDYTNIQKNASPLTHAVELSMNESLNLDQSYKHKFKTSGLLRDLDCSGSQELSLLSSARRKSLPVEELFSRNLSSAMRKVNQNIFSPVSIKAEVEQRSFMDDKCTVDEKNETLKDVVLYVSKKLVNIQSELNEIVTSLGGNYIWMYDSTCTHFVFTGKANDLNKEYREAKSQKKKIVHPEWVYACKDKNSHLEEELYPHVLRLDMSLTQDLVIVKTPQTRITESSNDIKADEIRISDTLHENEQVVDFNQQLNDLLVAAKSAKMRQSKRLQMSISSSPSTDVSPIQKIQNQISESVMNAAKPEEQNTQEQDTQSQGYPIVWDDPTGRQEREKIALAAAQKLKSNSKETPKSYFSDETSCKLPFGDDIKPMKLNFDDSCETKIRKFMFSTIPEQNKAQFIAIITQLGGEVSDEKLFDKTATHLLLEKPLKNEKLLCSVASGKWVIHPQYLTESKESGCFVSETDFEWGGPNTNKFAENLSSNSKKVAFCPSRWRKKLNSDNETVGAFQNWVVTIIADDKLKQATYSKILENGGAEIIPSDTSISALNRLSHVIVDMKKRSLSQIDLRPYFTLNIKCIQPEYLAFFLTEDPPPDVNNFVIPEAKDFSISETSTKRKTLSVSSRGSKKSRLTLKSE